MKLKPLKFNEQKCGVKSPDLKNFLNRKVLKLIISQINLKHSTMNYLEFQVELRIFKNWSIWDLRIYVQNRLLLKILKENLPVCLITMQKLAQKTQLSDAIMKE